MGSTFLDSIVEMFYIKNKYQEKFEQSFKKIADHYLEILEQHLASKVDEVTNDNEENSSKEKSDNAKQLEIFKNNQSQFYQNIYKTYEEHLNTLLFNFLSQQDTIEKLAAISHSDIQMEIENNVHHKLCPLQKYFLGQIKDLAKKVQTQMTEKQEYFEQIKNDLQIKTKALKNARTQLMLVSNYHQNFIQIN